MPPPHKNMSPHLFCHPLVKRIKGRKQERGEGVNYRGGEEKRNKNPKEEKGDELAVQIIYY